MRRIFPGLAAILLGGVILLAAAPKPPGRRVVLVVFDGMRPDFIRPETTPNLWALAQRGVFFQNHHAVYLSSTEVNGTALATGALPRTGGIVGNREFRTAIDPLRYFDTQRLDAATKGDALTKGKYVALPTVAEQVQAAGQRTVAASTKSVGLLFDRPGARRGETVPPSVDLFTGTQVSASTGGSETIPLSVPPEAARAIQEAVGFLPGTMTYPNEAQDAWTTTAVLDQLWRDEVPAFTTLWLSEPDYTQHQHGPGSPEALAAIRSSDGNLGRIVEGLKARGLLNQTDIFVVSDHGFSTVETSHDVGAALRTAGFDAVREFKEAPKAGQVMVVGNAGSIFLYVIGHDRGLTQKLVEHLQTSEYASAIFTRDKFEGTFSLAEGALDTPDAPEVVFSMRWSAEKSQFGVPGMLYSDGRRARGSGNHASLSRFEMHNTLVAAGPDIREGAQSETPSGNIDVAPTILHLLGLKPAEKMDGRVLREALRETSARGTETGKGQTERVERSREFEKSRWRQYLQVTRYGGSFYIDEGGATNESK